MSTHAPGADPPQTSEERTVRFAGILLLVVGVTNVIGGIAAIDDANVYARDAHYVFGNIETWGWVVLITGLLQGLTGVGIFRGSQAARWAGVGFVSLNLLGQLLRMPAFPLLSIALFAVDVLILFVLLVYADPEYAG